MEEEPIQRITHEYHGERFWLDVKMSALTAEWFGKMAGTPTARGVVKELAEVITDWDVTWDGHPFPPVFENLMKTPMTLLHQIVLALRGAALSNALIELAEVTALASGTDKVH